jgi:hypothetical protein
MPSMIDRVAKTYQEVAGSSFYRSHPWESLLFAYSKWKFSRTRLIGAKSFLRHMGIDSEKALSGFDRWRPILEGIISEEAVQQGAVGMDDGEILYSITRELRPEYVIETGVASGISSSFIAAALIENSWGTLFSMELPPPVNASLPLQDGSIYEGAVRPAGWAIPAQISQMIGDRHILVLQDVREGLPALLKRIPYVDMFVHDDLHTPDHMLWEYELVWPKMRRGGVLASDDVNHGWIEFCRRMRFPPNALNNVDRFCAVRKQ